MQQTGRTRVMLMQTTGNIHTQIDIGTFEHLMYISKECTIRLGASGDRGVLFITDQIV
jgi:hypothetical protein